MRTEETTASICVIGSYAQALVLTADRIPLEGETLTGWDYRETYGGKGSDMAVQAARLGAKVVYLGAVGNDSHGIAFRELASSEGIDVENLRVVQDKPTGVGLIIKDNAAHNVIVVDPGANDCFTPDDVDNVVGSLASCEVVLAQLEIPKQTALRAMHLAKRAGRISILNPAPAVDLRGVDLSDIDVITPNETEAKVILGYPADADLSVRELADELIDAGARAVVMTLGSRGSTVLTEKESWVIPPVDVDPIDSNGAGDSFNAGLAVGLSRGLSLVESAEYASAVSGLCCTRWETIPSYHTDDQVADFISRASVQKPYRVFESEECNAK